MKHIINDGRRISLNYCVRIIGFYVSEQRLKELTTHAGGKEYISLYALNEKYLL